MKYHSKLNCEEPSSAPAALLKTIMSATSTGAAFSVLQHVIGSTTGTPRIWQGYTPKEPKLSPSHVRSSKASTRNNN